MDANDYFLMVTVARERIDDLLSTLELARESGADDTSRAVSEPRCRPARFVTLEEAPVTVCLFNRHGRAHGTGASR